MTTTTTILPPPVAQEFSEKMLSTPMPHLVHNLFAIPRSIKGNNGKTLRMRRYNRLQTATVPVDPLFMNPPAQTMTAVDIDAKILCGVFKLILIDSEFRQDNEGQAQAA